MAKKKSLFKKTNPQIQALIQELHKKSRDGGIDIWEDIGHRLEKSLKRWSEVNVSKIDKYLSKGEIALIPGKVLGQGELTKKAVVAAQSFSKQAREKILAKGGECLGIEELMNKNPKGKSIRILG
jgi:large subunit ribosomal protein L18e